MIWLIGNRGMLGKELSEVFKEERIDFIGTDLEVDITNLEALKSFINDKNIQWIINCAAYTAVDRAEDELDLSFRLNALGPSNIGLVAKDRAARVIHISTDYVFDGTKNSPYLEDDLVNPLGVYGRSKAEGEKRLLNIAPDSIIIRTAWLYGIYGQNFVFTMLRLMREREEISVVDDQIGNPTWSYDLAIVVKKIVKWENAPAGIYHYANEGAITWCDFAREIYKVGKEMGILTKDCTIKPIKTSQYPTKAKRPMYSVLSKDKIKRTFHLKIPDWYESLRKFFIILSEKGERDDQKI